VFKEKIDCWVKIQKEKIDQALLESASLEERVDVLTDFVIFLTGALDGYKNLGVRFEEYEVLLKLIDSARIQLVAIQKAQTFSFSLG